MTLEQLIYYSEVYKQNSINAASFNLKISQQSLSHSIAQLENEFSSIFFIRTHKGVIATSSGKRFYSFAQTMLREYTLLQYDLADTNKLTKCKISLLYPFSTTIASQLFHTLTEFFPNTFFDITPASYDNLFNQPNADDPDIIFPWFDFIEETVPDGNLNSYTLKHISRTPITPYIWCNTNSLLAKYLAVTPKLLSTIPLVGLTGVANTNTILNFYSKRYNITFTNTYTAPTKDIFITLLKTKNYITTELCLENKPLLHPYLSDEIDLLLKPFSSNFKPNYLTILYRKEYEQFYYPIADFLTQNYNL